MKESEDMAMTMEAIDERCGVDRLLGLAVSQTGFIFDPQTGQSFSVNHTGLAALEALRRGESIAGTAQYLSETFNVSFEVAASSVEAFLLQMGRYL
jgi:hypothetical protein